MENLNPRHKQRSLEVSLSSLLPLNDQQVRFPRGIESYFQFRKLKKAVGQDAAVLKLFRLWIELGYSADTHGCPGYIFKEELEFSELDVPVMVDSGFLEEYEDGYWCLLFGACNPQFDPISDMAIRMENYSKINAEADQSAPGIVDLIPMESWIAGDKALDRYQMIRVVNLIRKLDAIMRGKYREPKQFTIPLIADAFAVTSYLSNESLQAILKRVFAMRNRCHLDTRTTESFLRTWDKSLSKIMPPEGFIRWAALRPPCISTTNPSNTKSDPKPGE
jgi:hypothetical protein